MARILTPTLAVIAVAVPAVALACGACIEDRIAATYDHATVTAAAASGHQVVFGAIEGAVDPRRAGQRIRALAPKIHGVHGKTLHVSVDPAAFSFALDRRATPQSVIDELERRVGIAGLRLTVIRVQ